MIDNEWDWWGNTPRWRAPLTVRWLTACGWYCLPWRVRFPVEEVVSDFWCWWRVKTTPRELPDCPMWIRFAHDDTQSPRGWGVYPSENRP